MDSRGCAGVYQLGKDRESIRKESMNPTVDGQEGEEVEGDIRKGQV